MGEDTRDAAHSRLMLTIARHIDHGRTIPCTGRHRDTWTTENDPEATDYARNMCLSCPALRACRAYVTEHPEPTGVWAGLTPTERKKKKS